jgi:hypothetical protein
MHKEAKELVNSRRLRAILEKLRVENGERGGTLVEALYYKLGGPGFDSR